jgi:hypothetical protein
MLRLAAAKRAQRIASAIADLGARSGSEPAGTPATAVRAAPSSR